MGDIFSSMLGGMGAIPDAILGDESAVKAGNEQKTGIENAENSLSQGYAQNGPLYNTMIQNGTAANNKASQMAQNGFGLSNFQQDPGYAFNMQQGLNAINNSQSVRGGALSGGAQKAMSGYAQQNASNEYQNAYNRFASQQGQLSALGNQGLSAAGMNAQYYSGMAGLNSAYGQANSDETLGKYGALETGLAVNQPVNGVGSTSPQAGNMQNIMSNLSSIFGSGANTQGFSGTAQTANSADNAMAFGENSAGSGAAASGSALSDAAFADAESIV